MKKSDGLEKNYIIFIIFLSDIDILELEKLLSLQYIFVRGHPIPKFSINEIIFDITSESLFSRKLAERFWHILVILTRNKEIIFSSSFHIKN